MINEPEQEKNPKQTGNHTNFASTLKRQFISSNMTQALNQYGYSTLNQKQSPGSGCQLFHLPTIHLTVSQSCTVELFHCWLKRLRNQQPPHFHLLQLGLS